MQRNILGQFSLHLIGAGNAKVVGASGKSDKAAIQSQKPRQIISKHFHHKAPQQPAFALIFAAAVHCNAHSSALHFSSTTWAALRKIAPFVVPVMSQFCVCVLQFCCVWHNTWTDRKVLFGRRTCAGFVPCLSLSSDGKTVLGLVKTFPGKILRLKTWLQMKTWFGEQFSLARICDWKLKCFWTP